jgi:hypothetical protein
VRVDEAGGDDEPADVDALACVIGDIADRRDAAVTNADVAAARRRAGAVDDAPAPEDQVEVRHRS